MLRIASSEELKYKLGEYKGVICWGAGRRLHRLEKKMESVGINEKLLCIMDSDPAKQNVQEILWGKPYSIYSFEDVKRIYQEGICIIITFVDFTDAIEKIEQDELLKNADVYVFLWIEYCDSDDINLKKKIPANLKLSDEPLIPKVIHYCWFGHNPIPDKNKRWIETWHKYCPDYEIIQWNEDNYDVTKNTYMTEAYQTEKWGFVSDYARLDVVYRHGGIYLDADVELVHNLDELLYQKGFTGFESDKYINFGLGYGAIKGLPVLKDIMDVYDNLHFVLPDGSLNMTPCPIYQTDILQKKGLQLNGEYQIIADMTVFPIKMFNPKNGSFRVFRPTSYTHSIHHFDSSWDEDQEKVTKWYRLDRYLDFIE